MSNILVTVCARGGSKGIPGKNIKPLNGTPLIGYSIKTAQQFCDKFGAHMALSTDSDEIKEVAAGFGLKTDYSRPEALASDTAGKADALIDILHYEEQKRGIKYDYLLDLDVTSPLRTLEDLEAAFEMLKSNPDALNIFSVSPANRNPYFNMVEANESGFVQLVKNSKTIKFRQEAPKVYDMNASFYFFRKRFFDEGHRSATTAYSMAFEVPHLCFDLDEPIDFTIMDYLLREDLLDFTL